VKFLFANKSSCCGSKNSTQLLSTTYPVDSADVPKSITQALDRFYTNYRVQPLEVIVSAEELLLLQEHMPGSDFSFDSGVLYFRKFPVKVVQ
jgi:hypothetical protein